MKEIKTYTKYEIDNLCNLHNSMVKHDDYHVNHGGMVLLIQESKRSQFLSKPYFLIPSNQTIDGKIVKFHLEWA